MPVALITGGQGSLALSLAAELKTQGYDVHAPGRLELDVTDAAAVKGYIHSLQRLDLLICNAAVIKDQPALKMDAESFSTVLDVNLKGCWSATQAALKLMSRQRSGHIIFISSFAALSGTAGQCNYAASKAAIHGLCCSIANEYGGRNIRCNTILPGFMETRMTAHLTEGQRQSFLHSHALGRFNEAASVAKFIAFLDQHMPHTSGQSFNLDSRIHRWS